MSWHFLREQEEESWEESCLDGAPSALLSLLPTQGEFSLQDSGTDCSQDSRSGMTLRRLTDDHGKDVLMWFQGDSPVRTYLPPEEEPESAGSDLDCGPKWQGLLARYNPRLYLWKTPQCLLHGGLESYSETFPRWGMMQDGELWGLSTPARRMNENAFGLWPTPVKTDGFAVGWCLTSIGRKERGETRPSGAHIGSGLKYFRKTGKYLSGGYPNPALTEWLMGWPIKWTDLQPLEMDKFQQWLSSHGKS